MPRGRRIKGSGESIYHIISRIVTKEFCFTPEENVRNQKLLRQVETFSGVQVLAYCFMSNHIHILLRVPKRQKVSDKQLKKRVKSLYGKKHWNKLEKRWKEFEDAGLPQYAQKEKDALIKRMYDMGEFMKTLKQRLTMSYNKRHDRSGTLWEERYKSILVEPTPHTLSAIAAYIDRNPSRAQNMLKDGEIYAFSSYGEACAGNKKAQRGLQRIYQEGEHIPSWEEVKELYTERLQLSTQPQNAPIELSQNDLQDTLLGTGIIPFSKILGTKIRAFSTGFALGSSAFVEIIRKQIPPRPKNILPKTT